MLTKYQAWLVVVCLLAVSQSSFNFKTSQSFYEYTVNRFTIAPSTVTTANYNLALGLLNGSVVLTNTENFNNRYFYYPHNTSIQALDWNQAGIFSASLTQVKVINPSAMNTVLSLNFTSIILFAITAYNSPYIMTAVSFSDRF